MFDLIPDNDICVKVKGITDPDVYMKLEVTYGWFTQ